MDNERFAMSNKVMEEEEEEWLKDVANRMMEPQVITNNKEAVRVGEEDVNIDVYLEFKYMDWLKSELSYKGIDNMTIAK